MSSYVAKMSSQYIGSSGYGEPRNRSDKTIYTYAEDYHPSIHEHRLYRGKDKIADYDDYHEVNDHLRKPQPPPSNGDRIERTEQDDNDVDYLYRRSREKFAAWDIKDLEDRKSRRPAEKRSGRRVPRDSVDAEVEDIFVNGSSGNSSSSPRARKINGNSERSGSASRRHQQQRHQRASESVDRKNSQRSFRERGSVEPWTDEEDEEEEDYEDELPRTKSEERAKSNGFNNREEAERFGSLKKKNEKNAGLNIGFRAIIDKFRTKSDDKKDPYRSKKQAYVDENWRYDDGNGYKERKSPEKYEIYPAKEAKVQKNHRIKDYDYDREPRSRRTPVDEEDYHHSKARINSDSDSSKRRSYAFEASPENFDVRIEKYERTRRNDPEVHRRNSFNDRGSKDSDGSQKVPPRTRNGTSVVRKSSLKDKEKNLVKSKPPKPKISERHSRPLTPPMDQQMEVFTSSYQEESRTKDSPKKNFSMKEWYESNRQFAARYLKEHSKVKELSTSSDISARDEFVFGSPKEFQTFYEIENLQQRLRKESTEDDENPPKRESLGIKIRAEEDSSKQKKHTENGSGRRTIGNHHHHHRRESVEDIEDEEEEEEEEEVDEAISRNRSESSYARSFVMPSRKAWNYRDGV